MSAIVPAVRTLGALQSGPHAYRQPTAAYEYEMVLHKLQPRPTQNFTWMECRQILANPRWSEVQDLLSSKGFGISTEQAWMEIVRSLQPLEFLDYCRAFAMCELDALAKQDRLCAIVAEYHDQLCTVNPDYRRQMQGCEYVESFLMKVAKRVADETKRKECDMAFLAKKWGTDWQEQVSCNGEYELALSQCARRELRRAAKLPEGSAQLFGHFLRQQVEERRTNLAVSKMRGGSRCDAAGRADMAKALVHYRNVRQAQVATATPIAQGTALDAEVAGAESRASPIPAVTSGTHPRHMQSPTPSSRSVSVSSLDTDNVSLPTVQITKPPEEATSHAESDLGQASDKFKAAKLDAPNKEIDVTEHPAEPTDNPSTFWPIFHDTLRYLLEAQSSVLQKRLTENRETLLGHKDLRLAHLTIGHLIRVMSMDSWMDDIALVSYLTMVVNHENRLRGKQVAIALESFFFEKLRGKEGYDGVRKWTAKLLNIVGGIKDLERILIPLHLDENHWALAVMHLPERQIRLHDSLQIKTRTNVVLKTLREYVQRELLISDDELAEWNDIVVDVPAQKGLVECGIIVCEVARLAINNAPIYYDTSESAIRRMRSVIAYELLQGCILENNHRCTVDDVSYAAAKSGGAAIVLNFSLPRLMVVNLQPGDPEFASSTSVRVTLQSSPASADDVSSSPESTDSDQTPEVPAEPVLECSGVAEPPNERHAEPNPEESELFICVPTTPKREMYRTLMQVRIPEFDKEMCDVLAIDKTPAPGTEDSTRLELADKAAPPVSQTSGREASTGRHQDIHMPPKIDADVEETTSPLTKVSPEVAERRNPFSATGNTQNYPSQMTSVQPPVSAIRTPNPIGALSHPGRPMLQGLLDPTKIDPTAAIAAIIGYEKVQAILAGQRVEITLPWNIPSSNFALSEMPDIVVWQVDMYRQLATDDSNTHCVHTALQLAARQDLLLWMLASWLWSAHEVIMLPVPAGKQPRWTNKPLAAWTAFVHSNSIELPWCKLIWMPLAQISPEEHGVIAFANAQGSSVVYAQGQYQALAFHTFQDHRGVLFQHPHPVSRALLGAGRWNSPDTMLAMSELMDPRRTRAILAAHGRVMLSCMIDSAMRSLRIDAAYRREESYLADRVKLWAESNRAERTGNILNAVCRGVAVVPEISMLVANDSGAATGGYNILRSLPHVGETRSWVIYQGMEWANGEMVGSDPGPAVGGREETVHGKRPFGGSGQGAEGQRVRRKVG